MVCELILGDVIQGGVWLATCPVLGTPQLHYINRLGINFWKWNVIIYIHNCFRINYVIIFCPMVFCHADHGVGLCHECWRANLLYLCVMLTMVLVSVLFVDLQVSCLENRTTCNMHWPTWFGPNSCFNCCCFHVISNVLCVCAVVIQESQIDPWPRYFWKVSRYASHFYGILLQRYALLLAESSIYTTNLYHDAAPICIAILLRKY